MTEFLPLGTIDPTEVERLLDCAFGPERRTRTAYQVRGDGPAVGALSVAAVEGGELVGSVQCWPVRLVADDGGEHPLTMMGPVAVRPDRQGDGLGRLLMTEALRAAHEEELDQRLMLIGDPGYYGRFFGFSAERTGQWRVSGPVERHRLLARGIDVPDIAGMLGPRR